MYISLLSIEGIEHIYSPTLVEYVERSVTGKLIGGMSKVLKESLIAGTVII